MKVERKRFRNKRELAEYFFSVVVMALGIKVSEEDRRIFCSILSEDGLVDDQNMIKLDSDKIDLIAHKCGVEANRVAPALERLAGLRIVNVFVILPPGGWEENLEYKLNPLFFGDPEKGGVRWSDIINGRGRITFQVSMEMTLEFEEAVETN